MVAKLFHVEMVGVGGHGSGGSPEPADHRENFYTVSPKTRISEILLECTEGTRRTVLRFVGAGYGGEDIEKALALEAGISMTVVRLCILGLLSGASCSTITYLRVHLPLGGCDATLSHARQDRAQPGGY